jgi:hypothetical protein
MTWLNMVRVVVAVHGGEFTVEQICEEVTVSQPVGPGLTPSIKLFIGSDVSQGGSDSVGKQQIGQMSPAKWCMSPS